MTTTDSLQIFDTSQEIISAPIMQTIPLSQYVEILEKTNQQMNLWYTPLAVSIGVLTFIIALLTIFFGYISLRQGREYKQAFQDFLNKQKVSAEQELARVVANIDSRVEAKITESNATLETLSGEAKDNYLKEIEALKLLRKELETIQPQDPLIVAGSSWRTSNQNYMREAVSGLNQYPITSNLDKYMSNVKSIFDNDSPESLKKQIESIQQQIKSINDRFNH